MQTQAASCCSPAPNPHKHGQRAQVRKGDNTTPTTFDNFYSPAEKCRTLSATPRLSSSQLFEIRFFPCNGMYKDNSFSLVLTPECRKYGEKFLFYRLRPKCRHRLGMISHTLQTNLFDPFAFLLSSHKCVCYC